MPAPRRRRRPSMYDLRVCTQCGHQRMAMRFPRLPGETQRGEVCTYCIRFPSTVYRAA